MSSVITTWTMAQETKQFIPITVTADAVVMTMFEVAFTTGTARPTGWAAATTVGGDTGILVGTGTPYLLVLGQKHTVWVKFTDNPEIPVTRACYIKVT